MLAPVAMFVIGLVWKVNPPKDYRHSFGYRTALSARSQETWDFAHHHISKLWMRLGVLSGILSAVLMVVFRDHYSDFVLWLIGGQMVFLCISAFLVDTALKNGFDEDGKPLQ